MKTRLGIKGDRFLINEELTYSEYDECPEQYKGLLMNMRMIQGVFDDKADISRFFSFHET